jgi:hypothetical protein
MRFVVGLVAAVVLTGCPGTHHEITPQDVANAYACMTQVQGVPAAVQSQVPACMALAQSVRSEGQ